MVTADTLVETAPREFYDLASAPLKTEIVSGWSAVDDLAADWDELAACFSQPCYWALPGWFSAWRDAFGGDVRPCMVTVRAAGQLVGLLPLQYATQRMFGLLWKHLRSLDNNYSPEFCCLLAPGLEEPVLTAALEFLMGKGGPAGYVKLSGFCNDSPAGRALQAVAAKKRWHCLQDVSNYAPELSIESELNSYEEALSSKTRKRLRRDIRRAHKLLTLQTELIETPGELEKVLPALREISRQSWQGEAGTGTFADSPIGAFYTHVSRGLAACGQLRMVLLTADGEPAAFELAAVAESKLMVLKREFDARHRDAGIGKVALDVLYKNSHHRGLKCLSLGAPSAPYKDDWANSQAVCSDWMIFPPG